MSRPFPLKDHLTTSFSPYPRCPDGCPRLLPPFRDCYYGAPSFRSISPSGFPGSSFYPSNYSYDIFTLHFSPGPLFLRELNPLPPSFLAIEKRLRHSVLPGGHRPTASFFVPTIECSLSGPPSSFCPYRPPPPLLPLKFFEKVWPPIRPPRFL